MIDIKNISEIDWVKNGDTLSGVYSIYDFSDGELDPYEYDYGINRPYRSLIDNDKKILKGIKDVAINFSGYDFSNDIVLGECKSAHLVPNLDAESTDKTFQLYPYKVLSSRDFGMSLTDFKKYVTKYSNPRDCLVPGLSGFDYYYFSLKGINAKAAVIQVKFAVRPFGCPTDAYINNFLTFYVGGKYSRMPVSFDAPTLTTYDPGHRIDSDKVWVPITNGCTTRQTATFLVDLENSDPSVRFSYTMAGTYAKYAALSFIDIEAFPVINGF